MKEVLISLKENIIVLLYVIGAFLAPIGPLLLVVGLFIIADTITGIIKVFKIKKKFTSRCLSKVISKIVLYFSAIILTYILDRFLLGQIVNKFIDIEYFSTKIVALFACGVEIVSMKENIKLITGIDFWSKFKILLKRAKETKDEITDLKDM